MSILEKARDDLVKLFDAYIAATNASPSTISLAVAKDSKFVNRITSLDMRLSTVDTVIANFAAMWPENAIWPEGVARPEVPNEARISGPRGRRSSLHPDWPAGVDWPADVPRPSSSSLQPA